MKKDIINEVWQFNKAIHKRFVNEFGANGPYDISLMQGMILMILHAREGENLGAKELQEIFCLSKATISETLGGLENKGFIKVETSKEDKRRKDIVLTEKAKDYVVYGHDKFMKMEDDIAKGIDEEDLKTFRKVAKQMRRNVMGRRK